MILKILLTGDVNLMNVTNPADPFAKVATEFESADLVFSNLECCFYEPDAAHAFDREGFFAPLILKTHPAEVCPVCSPIFEQSLGVLSLGTV